MIEMRGDGKGMGNGEFEADRFGFRPRCELRWTFPVMRLALRLTMNRFLLKLPLARFVGNFGLSSVLGETFSWVPTLSRSALVERLSSGVSSMLLGLRTSFPNIGWKVLCFPR